MDNLIQISRQRVSVIFILFLMVLLSSCSHVHRKDGPPDFYVDETKIPNAVPKVEPLAKFGNMPSYSVFGKRYYTLRSSKNYDEIGIASWYGTQFHAQRTSSGERYDMLSMTAAHKTLPLPTYVEVTNLKNNRKVIVKVNDRGPFMQNRLIDLSYVAAKKLGMLGHGTALVEVKAIDPTTYNKPVNKPMMIASKKPTSSSNWHNKSAQTMYLQVGAFRSRSNAEKLQQRLIALLDAPVKISNGKLYRVKVGPIKDVATAKRITQRLKNLGISSNKSSVA